MDKITYFKERIPYQYYIDCEGKIIKWKKSIKKCSAYTSVHYAIADDLFPNFVFPNDPIDYVMKLGWILCGSTIYNYPFSNKPPTQAQINKLDELGMYDKLFVLVGNDYYNYKLNPDLFPL
jgi:hypothetical protein